MKRLLIIPMLAMLLSIACQSDNTTIEGFESNTTDIKAAAHGGEYRIKIRSDKEWTAQSDVPWIMISPANGRGDVECVVKIDSTLVGELRTTNIRFSAQGMILNELAVAQEGYAPMAKATNSETIELKASAARQDRHFDLEIEATVEFYVESDCDWLTIHDHSLTLDRGARPRKTTLGVDWQMNSVPESRKATLTLHSKSGGELLSTISIKQAAAPLITDDRRGDSLAVVTIYEKLNCWAESTLSTTENMSRWECLRLWERGDKGLPSQEAIGRVRDLDFSYFNTEDDLPMELGCLKYLETLSIYGNVNTMLKDIRICPELAELEYLKDLRIAAFGLVELPENFANLGDTLETLDLNSNNFTEIPAVLTKENFPHLKSLNLSSNRRHIIDKLQGAAAYEKGVGMRDNGGERLKQLLLWDTLEELLLSYNYLDGTLPDFRVGEDGVRAYQKSDFAERGDSLNWAVERSLPRILPNVRRLMINLNFFTGSVPEWLLYHPRLLEWTPENLIYVQQERGYDSNGRVVGFDDAPTSREYYFEAYPMLRGRFEFNDEIVEE